jgi:endonuclease YncB( thermonuclease family)
VVEVIDGDSVLIDGQTTPIRIIGADTPAAGHCGYDEARAAMEELVLGKTVVVSNGAANTDVSLDGQSLRYLDVDGVDAGREMIARGLAITSSEARDGYASHLRQDDYLAVAAASPGPDSACFD